MAERRGTGESRRLCAGPGRLCQALGVDIRLDGRSLDQPPFALSSGEQAVTITAGPRIGISRAIDTPWRFCLDGSRFLSRPAPTLTEG
jgi:DNA-3-methyladenine glycosylase